MKIVSFEDIESWKKAKSLTQDIYKIFYRHNDFGYTGQIQRACVSIMNNIAEGFERRSNKELRNFLYIAKGSCGEVRSMLHLGKELNYINSEQFDYLYLKSVEISKLLSGFIKKL